MAHQRVAARGYLDSTTGLVTVVNADELPGPSALWLEHRKKDANLSLR